MHGSPLFQTRVKIKTDSESNPSDPTKESCGKPLFPNPGVDSPQKRISHKRNDGRLNKATQKDEEIISKYLNPSSFITATVTGPDGYFVPPSWLMRAIDNVAKETVETPKPPPTRFAMDYSAATYNSHLLEDHEFDFNAFLMSHRKTTLDYGSKFRPINQLKSILGRHPHFPELRKILSHGMDYRFTRDLPEDLRATELAAIIERGNHKSASH
jgi:hypothetical protein